jgi:hypothetical protein
MGYGDRISPHNYVSSLSSKVCLCLVVEDWDKQTRGSDECADWGGQKVGGAVTVFPCKEIITWSVGSGKRII